MWRIYPQHNNMTAYQKNLVLIGATKPQPKSHLSINIIHITRSNPRPFKIYKFGTKMNGMRELEIAGRKLLIRESHNTCDPVTGRVLTGSWLWESAVILSEWMAANLNHHLPEFDLTGKTVLELGAGTGLPGITAAAILGADRLILTDVGPLLDGLRANVDANGMSDRVEVKELVWGTTSGEDEENWDRVDVVLMADVFYDPSEMEGLAKTLRCVCDEGTRIWAASEVRTGTDDCFKVLEAEGFLVVEQPEMIRPRALLSEDNQEFKVFVVKPPALGETCNY